MAKKVSKNSQVGKRKGNASGKDYIKVVKSVKNPETGRYSYKEQIVHKDNVKEFLSK